MLGAEAATEFDKDAHYRMYVEVTEGDIMSHMAALGLLMPVGERRQRCQKCDRVFMFFEKDGDGFLNFAEMVDFATATGGGLSEHQWNTMCSMTQADAATGLDKNVLWRAYEQIGLGDIEADFAKLSD